MAQPRPLSHNLGFWSSLYAIKPDSIEETVQVLWQTIITEWFPSSQGYKLGFKSGLFLTNNNEPDAIVIQILLDEMGPNGRPTKLRERQIFQLECKRPSKDTPLEWENTTLVQHLEDLEATGNPSDRLYSAVAIGKKVKFYRFDGKEENEVKKLDELHEGIIDLEGDVGIMHVEQMMNLVKADGWRWAWS